MEEKRYFIPAFFSVMFNGKVMQIRSPEKFFLLEGRSVSDVNKIIPYLRTPKTVTDISEKTDIDGETIRNIIGYLEGKNIAIEAKGHINDQEDMLFYMRKFPDSYDKIQKRLKESHIIIVGAGSLGSMIFRSLDRSGIGNITVVDNEKVNKNNHITGIYKKSDTNQYRCDVLETIKGFSNATFIKRNFKSIDKSVLKGKDLLVFCPDFFAPQYYHFINRLCLKYQISWTSLRFHGSHGEIGPTVRPYQTACYECYDVRCKSNMDKIDEYLNFEVHLNANNHSPGGLFQFYEILSGYMSLEIINTLIGEPQMLNNVLHIDFENCKTTKNHVLKIPGCLSCGG